MLQRCPSRRSANAGCSRTRHSLAGVRAADRPARSPGYRPLHGKAFPARTPWPARHAVLRDIVRCRTEVGGGPLFPDHGGGWARLEPASVLYASCTSGFPVSTAWPVGRRLARRSRARRAATISRCERRDKAPSSPGPRSSRGGVHSATVDTPSGRTPRASGSRGPGERARRCRS